MKIKTIDVNAKEWFDKIYGNSYFAGTITLNYGMKDEETFLMPFKYGYGSSYEQEAKAILTQFNKISGTWSKPLRMYCRENNIIYRSSIIENCKKKQLKEIETLYNRQIELTK
tara:strand:+ start:230 stop:568 length:339 start_codon:yes stop_codon:yes gene_type:complete